MSGHDYPGSRSTRDGGTWEWFQGDEQSEAPIDAIAGFIRDASTDNERALRYAMINRKLKAAERGELIMFAKPEGYHDVKQMGRRAPEVLEIKWDDSEFQGAGERQFRLYFAEPPQRPPWMTGLKFAEKSDLDEQDEHINDADRIRVEASNVA